MIKRALVVSTKVPLRASIARVLQSLGYLVEFADSWKRALELAEQGPLEAAIIVSGSQSANLAQKLRGRVPRTIEIDERTHDLEARILEQLPHALTPRHGPGDKTTLAIRRIEQCTLDPNDRIFRDDHGRQVRLTRAEVALLATLMDNSSHVWSRAELRHAAFGRGTEPYDRSIDMLVARLRRKIEQDPKAPRLIVTVPGAGYQFAGRPERNGVDAENIHATDSSQTQAPADRKSARSIMATRPHEHVAVLHGSAERRQVTVLCCSLGQAARRTGVLDPEDFNELVGRFCALCTTVSTSWGGLMISSLGSDVIVIFGHPRGYEDDAERAVHAGLAVLAKTGELISPSDEPLAVRIGIATSLVLIGQDQSVIGEAVLLAPRLGNMAAANAIVVGERTRKLLGNVFDCEPLGSVTLDGIPAPVTAFRIRGKQPIQTLFFARRTEKLNTFVGREDELKQFATLWERAKSGKGQVALINGDAGIGKSRFCEAFLQNIAGQSHYVLRYQCSPFHRNTPFYPVINELEHATRFEPGDTADTKLRKLDALLSQVPITELDMLLHITLLSIPTNRVQSLPEMTSQRQRELTIRALIHWVVALARKRPVVAVLSDVQWIDDSTLELLTRAIASIAAAQVLILVNFRPDFFPRWLEQSNVTFVHLGRLPRDETAAIIRAVAGEKKIPPALCEEIITKADGVPLFAEELTQSVLESGAIGDVVDQTLVRDSPTRVVIPATLLGSLTERLDRLGSDKDIAQIGAAIGREFSYRLLAAITPMSELQLQSALGRLAAGDLIFVKGNPPDSTYVFKHALVQDAAYATMVRSRRGHLHSRIAVALLEAFPSVAEAQPELLAHHFAHAGLVPQAVDFLERAAHRALENSATVEAIGHLTRALELLASRSDTRHLNHLKLRLEVMLAQAMVARHGTGARNTWEALLRAKQTLANGTSDLSHKFSIFYGIWACHYVRGEVSEQRKAALEFLAEAERHNNTAALCVAHRTIGTTCFTMGEFAQALPHLKRARALYDGTKHVNYRYQYGQDIGVAALCYLSCALWHLGYADQAQEAAAEAIKCAEYVTHPLTLVYALCHAGFLMDVFRRYDKEMQPCAATVISLCGENGFPHWKSGGRILEGWAQVVHGRVHEGREKICSAVLDWRRGGARLWVPLFLMGQAQAHARAGDGHAALASIEEALAVVEVTGERWALAEVLRVKAGLLRDAAQNRTDEIETILVNSLEIARRQGARFWELRTACDLARLWQQQGRDTKGFELLGSIYDQFTEGFNTADMQDAKALIKSLRAAPLAKSLRMTKRVAGSTTNHKRAKARRDSRNGEFDERANGVAHSAAKRRDEREFPPKRR